MKRIPLDTKFDYFCTEDGRIFRGKKELKGWTHTGFIKGKGATGKDYLRFGLMMADGKRKDFYAQRLVGMTYHDLLKKPGMVMRHLTKDTMNNHKDMVKPGTVWENQTVDRIDQGTYMDRGGLKSDIEKDLPF